MNAATITPPASSGATDMLAWRQEQLRRSALRCERIPMSDSRDWRLRDGRLRHASGGYFGVVGVTVRSNLPTLDGIRQPLIDQPEIGILGFLLRRTSHGPELLMQAKTEPGTVGGVQLGPTVQATQSNYMRVHGGAATPYLQHFTGRAPAGRVADRLQSEQGTRFLGKYNRNVTVLVPGTGPEPAGPAWRWWRAGDVLSLAAHDFCLNTDARSSLVCSDWAQLCGEAPFARWRGSASFGERLLDSYRADEHDGSLLGALREIRNRVRMRRSLVPLERLAGWRADERGIFDEPGRAFDVGMYRVHAADREVRDWDQPLVANASAATALLLCQRRDGVLGFLLGGSAEIGFRERVQFGPTLQWWGARPDDEAERRLAELPCTVRAACRQSDEGGRFYRCVVDYRVAELDEDCAVDAGGFLRWASLGQVRALLRRPGATSNELRSALSLLLPWL